MNGKDLEGESLRIMNYYQKLTDNFDKFEIIAFFYDLNTEWPFERYVVL